jgi:putative ABC transport system substrate-binding protein
MRIARWLAGAWLCLWAACANAAPIAVGFVAPDEEPRYTTLLAGFRKGLQAAGGEVGQAVVLEHRIRRGDASGAGRAALALEAAGARVAFVVGTELTRAVRAAAADLPIVFITPGDPVRAGVAASLARPGNNLTGLAFEYPALSAKRIALLKEVIPSARAIGVVYDARDASPQQGYAAAVEVARRLELKLVPIDARDLAAGAVAPFGRLDGLLLIPGGAIAVAIAPAVRPAAARRIALVGWTRSEATRDATLTYGAGETEVAGNAARLVARILGGASAGSLAIEQPTKFELVINVRTARERGPAIPDALLFRADAVIR